MQSPETDPSHLLPSPTFWETYRLLILVAGFAFVLLTLFLWFISTPPSNFPLNTSINVERGWSASEVVDHLEEQRAVRSNTLLYFALVLFHDPAGVKAGTYVFSEPLSVWQVASRLTERAPPDTLITLTFPEGYAVKDYANIAAERLYEFDAEKFLALAVEHEGYLFPDTYYVPPDFSEEELLALLLAAYEEKTIELSESLNNNKLTEYGLLTLASIVEREANTPESMQVVAGILDTRLVIGMALQVDASMEYVLDKPLSELTPEDLEIDSPYNTYLYPGLPPTPIGNPGLQAIKSVLNPAPTNYLYYITDADGNFYYAETFDEHRENIAKYLR